MSRPRKNPPKPKMVPMVCACGCGRGKEVRAADVARGWGKYFSKACKANHQAKTLKKKTGSGRPKGKYSGGIANAPADVRAKTLIKALGEDRISTEFFVAVYPETQLSLLPDYLRDLVIEDNVGHMMSSGLWGHGQE